MLIAGKLNFVLEGKPHALVPGSYIVIPPKTVHSATCAAGAECVLLTRRAGPNRLSFRRDVTV